MSIGKNIRKIREKKGLTQAELGKLLCITQSAIGQFENDKTSPKIETLEKIASALHISPADLLRDDPLFDDPGQQPLQLAENSDFPRAIASYLKKWGFTITYPDAECHSNGTLAFQKYTLSKDGITASFTSAELNELQAKIIEVLEILFYKKVLEQQKKNEDK